jgi:excisionase family DNA binding protein
MREVPAALKRSDPLPLSQRLTWSIQDAARATGLSARYIWRAVAAGKLPVLRVGRRRLLRPDDVRAWLDAHQ